MTDSAITEIRNDGVALNALAMLGNRATGLGQQGRDKYLEHNINLNFSPLSRVELQALYRKSKICEKVVDLLPKAATANNWLEVTIGKGRKGIPAKAVQYSEDLKLRSMVREAAIAGRLDGDGFVIIGIDDGGEPWEPVNEGRIRKISWLYPVDRWRIYPETQTGRPGHPELYSLYVPATEALPGQQVNGKIHRSRVLRFPGKRLWGDMLIGSSGFHDSVLQTFFQSFVRYLIAIEYSTRMVQDYNQFVYKLQGLAQLIQSGDQEKIFHRFQAILMSMSSLGGLAMDADREDGTFISRNFGGLDALIDRLKDDTSAAAAMPPSQLWGSSQKTALSNSATGDKYGWADCVSDYRAEIFEEPIEDFLRLTFLAQNGPTGGRLPDSWGVSYRSALRLNLKEQTELRKDQTQGVDVPSIQAGVLLPEEVRESAWSGSEYTIERQLQPDLWAKQQAEAEEQAEAEGEEAEAEGEGENETEDTVSALSDVFEDDEDDDDDRLDKVRLDAACGKGWKGTKPSDHPDHAAYKAGFAVHGGKGEIAPQELPKVKTNSAKARSAKNKSGSRTSTRERLAALKAKPAKTKSDKETLEANGHSSFEVKSRLAELAKLDLSDAGDKAYKNALLHPIDPNGSTEAALDRTQDQRRLRGKQSLDADQVRDAGANLRQGMRGVAGGENNRAVLEYSAQIYDRLSDSQKNAFAAEAGKAIHDDPLYKVPRYGKLIADIKERHGRADSDDGGSDRTLPKSTTTGGTSRIDAVNPVVGIIDRADKLLQGLEDSAIERVNSALESSYQALEAQILRSYSQETPGSLMGRERAAVLLLQVSDLLQLLNTRSAEDIQQAFEDLLRGAAAQGVTLADDLSRAIANQQLQATANVPIAAIVNQATEGMTRLRNHTEAFADKASTIVTQGLIQGFGTDKIASLLHQQLGVVKARATAIARTESLAASNASAIASYQANGLSLGTWQSTLDSRLCPFCAARNQKIYRLEDIVLPAHVACRCFASPASERWLQLGLIDTKWATDFRAKSLAELRSQGLEPDDGASPFERANGLDAPEPVWSPEARSDSFECDEWREDAGTPCGRSWIKAGAKCTKGVSGGHPSANPNHPGHAAYQGTMAATTGKHTHPAAQSNHPDHAAYAAAHSQHGGKTPLPSGGGGAAPAQTAAKSKAAKQTGKRSTSKAQSNNTPISSTTPAQPANPVKLNQTELTSKRADLEKRFGKKLVQDAEANTKKVLSDADVFVRVGSTDTLEKVLGSGFKTSAELNVTGHSIPNLADKNYQDARNRVEARTLGYDAKTTQPGDRPIYGYLGSSDLNGQSHADVSRAYGSIAVKLKSDVKDRASFTGADSFKSGIASEVNNPNAASLVSLTRHGYDRDQLPAHYPSYMKGDQNDQSALQNAAKAKSIDDLAPKLSPTGNAYMEAQVHGGVKPSDIAAIHFEPSGVSDRPSADVAKFAKANNVDLYVSGKKLSSQEVDHIITPPTDHALHNLNDALDKGDLQGIFTHVDTIATHAATVKMASGERDKYLKAMYQIAGYDGKPTVGSSADVTKTWQDGGTLMVRGVNQGTTDRTQFLKQFQTGDYFTGNGIYGNGTYVGHAGTIVNGKFVGHDSKTATADAKRAFDDVAKHNYINSSSVTMQMALTKDAKVATQSAIQSQRKAALKKLQVLQKAEEKRIQSAGQNLNAADLQKYNAAHAKASLDNDAEFGTAKPKLTGKIQTNFGAEELHSYSAASTAKGSKLDFQIKSEQDLFGAIMGHSQKDWHYQDENGSWQKVKTRKEALDKGHRAAIARKSTEDALKAAGLTHAPGQTSQVTQQKLKALRDKIDAVKHVMGLNLGDTNGISYFAMIKGYDAVALNQSYEKKTFMTLLNRSKVVIQKDELDYTKAKKTGAL
ncbi:MAG: DUF3626 domain-containing protein [Lyngbya sp. HA4199-MV5]|jgi:phage-related protein (TIGR01555 family)|nr:DUF3626 domain-containing protein [Lyngbya sp. HA4199-MV5]